MCLAASAVPLGVATAAIVASFTPGADAANITLVPDQGGPPPPSGGGQRGYPSTPSPPGWYFPIPEDLRLPRLPSFIDLPPGESDPGNSVLIRPPEEADLPPQDSGGHGGGDSGGGGAVGGIHGGEVTPVLHVNDDAFSRALAGMMAQRDAFDSSLATLANSLANTRDGAQAPSTPSSGASPSNPSPVAPPGPPTLPPSPPPSPTAPVPSPTSTADFRASTAFLYTGSGAVQTGVAAGTIQPLRAGVLRGRVLGTGGAPVAGVAVTVLGHPEFGRGTTRADGWFDMAVNGGGQLVAKYEKPGFPPVQRTVEVPWQNFAIVDDVALTALDAHVTTIDLSAATPFQVARGTVQTDTDGSRQATLLFPQGEQATMTLPDGSTAPLMSLDVRETEYTVGATGPMAMPGTLPPTSGYTYAVELSVDQAMAAGATRVNFTQAVPFYVENFLHFPVGMAVPSGYYDRGRGAWVPSDNGRVIAIVSETAGVADIDIDGDGNADSPAVLASLGVTAAERVQLANLYAPGASLWRVPIDHFTPWDCNWPYGPPDDAKGPDRKPGEMKQDNLDHPRKICPASVVGIENQTYSEAIPLAGTPFSLVYQSDRTPGFTADRTLTVPLTGDTLPPNLKSIELTVEVAGRRFSQSFAPGANLKTAFTWDGIDAFGRTLQGGQEAKVEIGYVYDAVYTTPQNVPQTFGLPGLIQLTANRARQEATLSQSIATHIGIFDARSIGLGGLTLDVNHTYDPVSRILHLGDGSDRTTTNTLNRVISTVVGDGVSGFGGDGGSATQASLDYPYGIALGPDGSLYIADSSNFQIRRVGPDGVITTVAGTGVVGGDGGPATQARLKDPTKVALRPDGSLYIADNGNSRVRRVGSDGVITTFAGGGDFGFGGDGGPAAQASLSNPSEVALGPDGSLYIDDNYNDRIRRVSPVLPGFSVGEIGIASEDGSELYRFDRTGRHLQTLDALTGSVIHSFAYDALGRLASVTDADHNVTTIERDPLTNTMSVVGPFGQRNTLRTNAEGYLSNVTNPAGETYTLGYGSGGLLTSFTNPRGDHSAVTYDDAGRLVRDEDAAHGFTQLARQDLGGGSYQVDTTNAVDGTRQYRVEPLPDGSRRRTAIDGRGFATVTLIGTDGSERTTSPDGTVTTTVYGPDPRFGMLAPVVTSLTISTPGGVTSTTTTARAATFAVANESTSQLATLTETTTVNGNAFTTVFDAAAHKVTSTTAAGRTSVSTLDARGRVVLVEVPVITPTSYDYDSRGRLARVTQGSRVVSNTFDTEGRLATITDPLGRVTRLAYDAAGRVTRQTQPDGTFIDFAYDAAGNMIGLTPPGQPEHTFSYDATGQLVSEKPPNVSLGDDTTRYVYNLARQLVKESLPGGVEIDYTYCECGRLTGVHAPWGDYTYTYSTTTGELQSLASPGGFAVTFGRDGGLLTSTTETGPVAGRIDWAYDANFRVTSESFNGANAVTFAYDADGLLTRAGDLTIARDAATGRATGTTLGVVGDSVGYNVYGEENSYQARINGATGLQYDFTLDPLGRITRKVETIGGVSKTTDYGYDLNGQLTTVTENVILVQQYAYDANGNRLSLTTRGGTVSGTYDARDRLLTYGTKTYSYAANGSLRQVVDTGNSRTTGYTYDAFGNLTRVDLPDGRVVEYLIDGENRQVGKKVNGVLLEGLLYDGQLQPVARLGATGNVDERFVYATGVNVPAYMVKDGVTYRLITDQLGSVRLVVNAATGAVAQRLDYDAFGRVTLDTNPGFQPFGFAGGLYDADTGLVRFGARDYEALTGRWMAKDPIGFEGGVNLYQYAVGSPVQYIDPAGTEHYTYSQSTGQLADSRDNAVGQPGYAGRGAGCNNPDAQNVVNTGPAPRGSYTVGTPRDDREMGRRAIPLIPTPETRASFPRDRNPDSFYAHGDNSRRNNTASEGCLILPRATRDQLRPGDTITVTR